MLIHSIEFENYATGQKIQKLNFDELNLLVGVSGAGKTQILKTLSTYIAVASGHSLIDVHIPWAGHFKIDFTIHNYSQSGDWVSKNARWEIATDPAKSLQGKSAYEISSEVLLVDDKKIIERDSKSMRIDGQNAPLIDSKKKRNKNFQDPSGNRPDVRQFFHDGSLLSPAESLGQCVTKKLRGAERFPEKIQYRKRDRLEIVSALSSCHCSNWSGKSAGRRFI